MLYLWGGWEWLDAVPVGEGCWLDAVPVGKGARSG